MPKKILIVEDEKDVAKVLVARLQGAGYTTIVAGDGTLGVQYTHREKPDLIILDLMMPAGGGMLVLESLKLCRSVRYIPVVILTGMKDDEYRKKVEAMGVDAFFEKPYEAEDLLKTIAGILQAIEGGDRWHA
ncbi:MAG: response regulator [Candidatus Omnitrophica bacterium]|jgi:Response regulators consisting of a CheY-like receiver domain and a winged-helix DNA-binding domain|nr:response regulator [Candidatus Omnitrophota bacterium]